MTNPLTAGHGRKPSECWLIDMDGVLVHEGPYRPSRVVESVAKLVDEI